MSGGAPERVLITEAVHAGLEPLGRRITVDLRPELWTDRPALLSAVGDCAALVVRNQTRIDRELLRQLGRQVHASMARAIHPFHALTDGDVLFAATTNEVENEALDSVALGVIASELAWDAVLAAVRD